MRPIRRGSAPTVVGYANYQDAKTDLISRLGSGWLKGLQVAAYCSFCERKIETMLAVEHIEPKDGPFGNPALIGRWSNFLLACVNCNSTKGTKQVIFTDLYLPDRDNTFFAFQYLPDGNIVPNPMLSALQKNIAEKTLALVGLDKAMRSTLDEHGRLIAEDRASQRMQMFGIAESALADLLEDPNCEPLKRQILANAVSGGFFSVWMTVFSTEVEMRRRLIDAFSGTRNSICFMPLTELINSPAPNPDGLSGGGKI